MPAGGSGADGDLDLDLLAAVGRQRDQVAGDLLAVDDETLHAVGLGLRVLHHDRVGDAAELALHRVALPLIGDTGIDAQAVKSGFTPRIDCEATTKDLALVPVKIVQPQTAHSNFPGSGTTIHPVIFERSSGCSLAAGVVAFGRAAMNAAASAERMAMS